MGLFKPPYTPRSAYVPQYMYVPQRLIYTPPCAQTQNRVPQGMDQGVNRQVTPIQPQLCAEPRMAIPQLIDLNMIAEAIRRYFGVQLRPLERPIYRKPYP